MSFTDDRGNTESLTTESALIVTAANSPATGAPTITGTAQVGETLTASTTGITDSDGLTSATFTYRRGWPTTRRSAGPPAPPTRWWPQTSRLRARRGIKVAADAGKAIRSPTTRGIPIVADQRG